MNRNFKENSEADHFADNGNSALVDALKDRGVEFPLQGFAPGLYDGPCQSCRQRFTGYKRSISCLPCAIAKQLKTYDRAYLDGMERAGLTGIDEAYRAGVTAGRDDALDTDVAAAIDERDRLRIEVQTLRVLVSASQREKDAEIERKAKAAVGRLAS